MRIKLVILLIGLTLSCKNGGGTVGENIEGSLELGQKESAVVSTLIDEISFPLPPPPPPDDGNFELFQKRLDSLELVKMKILIDTTLIPIDDSLRLPKEYAAFQPLADRIPQLEQTVLNPEYVKSQEGHSLDFGGSPEEMEGDVELQLRFSSVALNETKDRAVVYAGTYRGSLASSFTVYVLEKNNGKWVILHSGLLQIS